MATRTYRERPAETDLVDAERLRDRQARGKNYADLSEDEDDALGSKRLPGETFEDRQRIEYAEAVLTRPERLWMYALANDDTIAHTRHSFMKKLIGMPETPRKPAAPAQRATPTKRTQKRGSNRFDAEGGGVMLGEGKGAGEGSSRAGKDY